MASTDEVLREVALLALGAMPVTPINPHPAHQAFEALKWYRIHPKHSTSSLVYRPRSTEGRRR